MRGGGEEAREGEVLSARLSVIVNLRAEIPIEKNIYT